TPILDRAFVERTALMSTSVEEGMQRPLLADNHNRDPGARDQQWLQLLHTGFVGDRRPILRRIQKRCVVDAHPPAERQASAEKGANAHRAVASQRQQPSEGSTTGLTRKPRCSEEPGRYNIGRTVHQAEPSGRSI